MKKRGLLVILLFSLLFLLGCKSSVINETKGILSYSIKGCINKQFNTEKRTIKEESIVIESTENSINFKHKATHLCGLDIELQQSIKDAQITIIEIFTGQGAKCICDSEISAKLFPIGRGVYNLKIYTKVNDEPPELIKESEIAVGTTT